MKKIGIIFLILTGSIGCNPLTALKSQSGENSSTSPVINTPPTITNFTDQTVQANDVINGLAFQITDSADTLDCSTSVSVSSDSPTIVASTDVVITGTAPNCFAQIIPRINQYGTVHLNFEVSDGELTANSEFDTEVKINASVFPGLVAWHDASDQDTLFQDSGCTTPATAQGDPVGCWQDKSQNSHKASMTIPSQIPVLNFSDNIGSIEFNGIDSFYDDFHNYTARTVFVIYRIDNTIQQTSDLAQIWGQYSVGHVALDARSFSLWSFDGNAAQTASYALHGDALSGATTGNSAQPWSYNNFEMIRTVFSNDLSITRQVIGSLVPNFAIGLHQFGGQISEILVYSGVQTAADTLLVEGYLACKWSLQADLPPAHPHKVNCP